MHLLTDHPEVEERLLAELDGLSQTPDFEALSAKKRPYLHAVASETLRLYPSVPVDIKQVVEDDFLPNGSFVPAGTFVAYTPYVMGRLTSLWGEDAAEFRPERWLNAETGAFERCSQYKYPVFNAGFRLCLGMDMALLEIKAMLSLMFQRYKPTKEPGQDLTYGISLTCPAKNGIRVSFARR